MNMISERAYHIIYMGRTEDRLSTCRAGGKSHQSVVSDQLARQVPTDGSCEPPQSIQNKSQNPKTVALDANISTYGVSRTRLTAVRNTGYYLKHQQRVFHAKLARAPPLHHSASASAYIVVFAFLPLRQPHS
jgi:hypothetical protein